MIFHRLAVRLYGSNAIWKDVAQRLLDDTCQQRHREPRRRQVLASAQEP
jgi:hypothetical protein